jgi:hypothetical protein
MKQPASEYRDSAVWSALEGIVRELSTTQEIVVNTAPDYVIAHICRELAAKRLISEAGMKARGRGSSLDSGAIEGSADA